MNLTQINIKYLTLYPHAYISIRTFVVLLCIVRNQISPCLTHYMWTNVTKVCNFNHLECILHLDPKARVSFTSVGKQLFAKEVFHIISFEPISERLTSKSFHEPSVKLVRMDVIGTFWRATIRELYHITWIVCDFVFFESLLIVLFTCYLIDIFSNKCNVDRIPGTLQKLFRLLCNNPINFLTFICIDMNYYLL